MTDEFQRFNLRKSHHLRGRADFQRVYEANIRRSAGPLLVYAGPNGLNHSRLGLAVSRRVGKAVVRNAIRRRLKEAFRIAQHEIPTGYDFVVCVRPHEVKKMQEYQQLLLEAAKALRDRWQRNSNPPDHRSLPAR